ncbi:23S rRNA pseudouridine1911/1915/1917 synthase [Rhodoblastus acidophilus]|jgi:23S rRNA pseudouridine1911/1915/1917 synthase|nr:23S rRNA pseudouridine1911/1915/1917 synthase [Rhodoblastus acidophilus]
MTKAFLIVGLYNFSSAVSIGAMKMIEIEVDEADAGQRLDQFLSAQGPVQAENVSRTRVQALIEAGHVTIDGARAGQAKLKIRAAQKIAIEIPDAAPAEPMGEDIPINVVFEDDHIVVIDKPAGLVVHPGAGNETGTLVNALIAHCGDSLSGIGGVKRPGIVHRLDKDTSGLLVIAKTDGAHQKLSRLFADHGRRLHLTREYLALVWGAPDRQAGAVDAPIGRHAIQREKMAVVPLARGREAITHWRVLENFGRDREGRPIASLIACELETGRTHQIRVHMAHIGHPLLGDQTYGAGFKTKASHLGDEARTALAALNRQALHARALGFNHPITGEELLFESDAPQDFAELVRALKN